MADTTIQDPLGRQIILHDHTWFGHVIMNHPELKEHRQLVEEAVRSPVEIRISPSDPACRLYFGAAARRDIMTMVVANVVDGYLKTAHFVKSVKGVLEWSRPTA
jgi:hypothetical protein